MYVFYDHDSAVQKGAEKMCRENTSPGLRLIVQMKGGKQNLERVYNFLAMGLSVAP